MIIVIAYSKRFLIITDKLSIEHLYCRAGLVTFHLHEPKTAGAAGVAVGDDRHLIDGAVFGEDAADRRAPRSGGCLVPTVERGAPLSPWREARLLRRASRAGAVDHSPR